MSEKSKRASNALSKVEDVPFVLLLPRYKEKFSLIWDALSSKDGAYYYELSSPEGSLFDYLARAVKHFQSLDPLFGKHTLQAVEAHANGYDLAEAFVLDLKKAKPKPRYIIFDALDKLNLERDPEVLGHFQDFAANLSGKLPRGTQIIISARYISVDVWRNLLERGKATTFGDEESVGGPMYGKDDQDKPHLEIYALGGGTVFLNGLPVTVWEGPLPRNLFYFLVDHPLVTRDEIFQTFWQELPSKEATNVFHVTKRKITERLGRELTSYSGGFYRPSQHFSLHYDVAEFERIVAENQINLPRDPDAWYRAIQLYKTPFLNHINMDWITQRREGLRLTYAEALIGAARANRENGDLQRSVSFYLRALREVPTREDVHRELMAVYKDKGEVEKAIQQYQFLADMLDRTMHIKPDRATQNLYKLLRSER
jgi:DNA-binding SARP family transcriptional activator